jgi:hypothetical protein
VRQSSEIMELKPGMWVRHPKQESWGVGEVLECEEEKARIVFAAVGEKLIDLRYVTLEQVETPAGNSATRFRLRARAGVNMTDLEGLCNEFHEQFKARRSNTDDGRMALNVLEDMRLRGNLSKTTARQLFSWTQTGASYTQGVDLAQQICRLIYGRVPTRAEIETAGLS